MDGSASVAGEPGELNVDEENLVVASVTVSLITSSSGSAREAMYLRLVNSLC